MVNEELIQEQPRYTQQKVIEISYWKAVSIVSAAVLVSIVGTAFTIGGVLNSDHFLLARTVDEVTELQEGKLDKDIYEVQQQQILDKLQDLEELLTKQSAVPSTRSISTTTPRTQQPTQNPSPTPAPQEVTIITTQNEEPQKEVETPEPTSQPSPTPVIRGLIDSIL